MHRRSQLLISDEVQYTLLLRVTTYWVLLLVANCLALAMWIYWIDMPNSTSAERRSELIRLCIPLIACSLVIVPVFLYDIIKLTNQFVGPIVRIRQSLQNYIDNGKLDTVNLRRGDFWQSLANEFNKLFARQRDASPVVTSSEVSSDPAIPSQTYPEG